MKLYMEIMIYKSSITLIPTIFELQRMLFAYIDQELYLHTNGICDFLNCSLCHSEQLEPQELENLEIYTEKDWDMVEGFQVYKMKEKNKINN
jgi:hypothetical protein